MNDTDHGPQLAAAQQAASDLRELVTTVEWITRLLGSEQTRGLDLVRALVRALVLGRALVCDLDRLRTSVRELQLVDARDHERALARARSRARSLVRDLELVRARDRARDRALDRARDLDRVIDRALDRDGALDRERARTRDLDRDLYRARARTRDFDRACTRARAHVRDLDLDLGTAVGSVSALVETLQTATDDRGQELVRPARQAVQVTQVAVRLLPPADQARYCEEYVAELSVLAADGAGRGAQLRYALAVACQAWRLRRALSASSPRRWPAP